MKSAVYETSEIVLNILVAEFQLMNLGLDNNFILIRSR